MARLFFSTRVRVTTAIRAGEQKIVIGAFIEVSLVQVLTRVFSFSVVRFVNGNALRVMVCRP